ncbi:hypothetical protein PUV54_08090 [Hyphococcus flavus]|uniref:Uncharacterized protein n=1 Tax=Hyphococcus flavus TaxID=1866326 RepID=A0AAE9ZG17_9PROT|nr:hypothetical protein [Hyphococcus flavus]WDI33155.1 hypothetical protein PUV54_08090 [Hyphococcus flavus]
MSESRELLSRLDRAQLYTLVEIAILVTGFIGTLVTQQFWVALVALTSMFAFSRLISRKMDQSVENEFKDEWDDD